MQIAKLGLPALMAAALGSLSATQAQAAVVYGYAQQSIYNLVVTGQGLSGAIASGSTSAASAVINGSGVATNSPTDALQAYQGASPASPQNYYLKYSTQGGGPQAGDFTRGDALVSNAANLFGTGASGYSLAESSVSSSTLETGSSNWQVAGTFLSTGPAINVTYSYANDIYTQSDGTAPAGAAFGVSISVKDQHGHEVDATPAELTTALTAPPNGPELITSGTGTATLSLTGMFSGDILSVTINGQAFSSVGNSIPEPASLAVVGLGGLLLGRRRRR